MLAGYKTKRAAWLGAGMLVGLVIGSLFPQSPIHATATDRQDTFAMATGLLDEGVEAVYTLDFLTGELRGAVLNPSTRTFGALYQRNISEDLKVEPGKNPKYVMVTGNVDLRSGGQFQFGDSVIYIAELGTGNLGVYAVPFNPSVLSRPGPAPPASFFPLQVVTFRTAAVRGQ
jgi:hypothetical protein